MIPWMPTGGSSVPPFKPVLATDQAGDLPLDASALQGAGTGFSRVTGVARIVMPAAANIINGYRENQIAWTRRLLDQEPTYDPAADILQIAMVVDTPPTLNAADPEYGFMYGLLDSPPASKATADGLCHSVLGISAVAWQSCGIGATTLGGNDTMAGTPKRTVCSIFRSGDITAAARDMQQEYTLENTAGVSHNGGRTDLPMAMDDEVTNWHLCWGHIKNQAGLSACDMSVRLYTRVLKTGGWFRGLP